ncbi:hypothetical protein Bca52824_034225, partial [Brassica carinata]
QGFCFGFVEFETSSCKQSALEVKTSPITIGDRQVVIEEKKTNRGNSGGGRGRYLEEEEVLETKVSKEDVVVVVGEEEVMVEMSFLVDQIAQTDGVEEKLTKEFLKTESVEGEEEDVAGLAVVVHLDFACKSRVNGVDQMQQRHTIKNRDQSL